MVVHMMLRVGYVVVLRKQNDQKWFDETTPQQLAEAGSPAGLDRWK